MRMSGEYQIDIVKRQFADYIRCMRLNDRIGTCINVLKGKGYIRIAPYLWIDANQIYRSNVIFRNH